jgi:hypothetical protein
LVAGLESGKIGALARDVFEQEPPPADHPLLAHDRVICTPHLGASTKEAQVQVAVAVAEQIVEFASGGGARNALNLPRIDPAELPVLAPWLDLAERMGAFCGQIEGGKVTNVTVEVVGDCAELSTAAISSAALAGTLRHISDHGTNTVNARLLAEERGIAISEVKTSAGHRTYQSALRLTVTGEQTHTVLGTLSAGNQGRFVEIDSVALEVLPAGWLIFMRNDDTPGVIGHLGSVLGEAGINISRMTLGLDGTKGGALSVVNIDNPASDAVLQKLLSHVTSAQQVEI